MSSPLAGAWELVSDTHHGIAVFTDTYFSATWITRDRSRFAGDEPTEAEAAEAYRTLNTAAGTYEISGDMITFHRIVNRNPSYTGQDVQWQFRRDGDELTMGHFTWKKVG